MFEAWRSVEAQHIVATMRLVDSLDEQEVLERMLESSKPPLPPQVTGQHYLAFTPFRYLSPYPSRFRRANEPGVWYGAEGVETACTELAWWGHALLTDSAGLANEQLLTEFTVFPASVEGVALDLRSRPWNARRRVWQGDDYEPCQRLAEAARERQVAVIRYASARHVEGGCCAVLDVTAILSVDTTRMQTWHRRVSRSETSMIHRQSGRSIVLRHESDEAPLP